MKRALKGAPPPQILIPDTSILWHEDKTHPVDPEFDTFWSTHETLVTLEVVIPEVVRTELVFQQTTSAGKAFDRAVDNFATVSAITGKAHRHRLAKDKLRTHVESKIEKWMHGKHASVCAIPTSSINWDLLCEAALWRKPPFTLNAKNPEIEKGFRDALILETVVNYASTCTRNVNIAFVSRDTLLRESAAERMANDPRCSTYESLDDFSSYIKLTREKLTNEFIKSILRRARLKFFDRDNVTGLYFSAKLDEQIKALVKEQFDNPMTAASSAPLIYGSLLGMPSWEPIAQYKRWISSPEFQRTVDDADYYWRTVITCVGQFRETRGGSLNLGEHILVVPVAVFWHSRVLKDGRFTSLTFDKLELQKASFRKPTDEDIARFHLKTSTELPAGG